MPARWARYVDTELALLHAFGAYGLPTTVLIDPSGKVVAQCAKARPIGPSPSPIAYFKKTAAQFNQGG